MSDEPRPGRSDQDGNDGVDPRYDPVFQRGYAGEVSRLRPEERPFVRPGSISGEAEGAAIGAPERGRIAYGEEFPARVSERIRSARVEAERDDPGHRAELAGGWGAHAVSHTRPRDFLGEQPFWRNPFVGAILVVGVVGTALGTIVLWWALTNSFSSEATTSVATLARQYAFYVSIPLMTSAPLSAIALLTLAAARWRERTPSDDIHDGRWEDADD